MPVEKIIFDSDNPDAKEASVYWYHPDDGVFIEQVEKSQMPVKDRRELLYIGRKGIPALIAALQQALSTKPS